MHAALVDIGNVLLTVDFEEPLRQLVAEGPDDAHARIRSLLEKKDELESGKMEDEAFIAWASDRLGFGGTPEEFRVAWNSIFAPIEPMWTTMRGLKDRGLRLILFSNTNRIHADHFMPSFEIFDIFDEAIFSHEVGAIKPDPAIYRHAIERYGLDPRTTLYIDDLPENIATGRDLGFHTHQYDYRKHDAALDWLRELVGLRG